jgi:hypothetical protein
LRKLCKMKSHLFIFLMTLLVLCAAVVNAQYYGWPYNGGNYGRYGYYGTNVNRQYASPSFGGLSFVRSPYARQPAVNFIWHENDK